MKLKQQPDDFQVEEMTDRQPEGAGPFALYRLEKRGWTTPDALQMVRRRWRIEPRRLSYGGLKDRHAATVQYFTIFRGPERQLHQQNVAVQYLGQTKAPYGSSDIRANRFRLTLRDLLPGEIEAAGPVIDTIRKAGLPNYFDDQRFGSVSPGGEFVARLLVRGQYEEALRLALAAPYAHDRAEDKKIKATLRQCWGDWAACKQQLPRSHARSLVDYLLSHPTDFKGAIARLRPELRGLYLSAYQSYLWNRLLASWLQQHCRGEQLLSIRLQIASLPVYRDLTEEQMAELATLRLPLPSARVKLAGDDPIRPLLDAVMAEEGYPLEEMRLRGFKDLFFSKGDRAALLMPAELQGSSQPDELNSGKEKLLLGFDLPRGAYATLIVKRLQAVWQKPSTEAIA